MPAEPMVEIIYCRLCGWGLRAGWMAQELLATFAEEIGRSYPRRIRRPI